MAVDRARTNIVPRGIAAVDGATGTQRIFTATQMNWSVDQEDPFIPTSKAGYGDMTIVGTPVDADDTTHYIEEGVIPDTILFLQAAKTAALSIPTGEGLDGGSAEFYDKMLEYQIVDSVAGTITGWDFSNGNALRTQLIADGFPMSNYRWHAFGWHLSYSADLTVDASTWVGIINDSVTQAAAQVVGWSDFLAIDMINEQVDSSEADYVRNSAWRIAAEADPSWTYDSAFWWMQVFIAIDGLISADTKLYMNNYAYEQGKQFGFGSAPTTLDEQGQEPLWERARVDLINAQSIAAAEGVRGVDGIGFQCHFRPSWALHNEVLKWRLWECNLWGLETSITEINMFRTEYSQIGMTAGTAEADAYGQAYMESFLNAFVKYSADVGAIQSWTAFGQGDSNRAIPAFQTDGTRTFVADAIANVLANPPEKDARRAAYIPLYNVVPADLTGTIHTQSTFGLRPDTEFTLPWGHIQRAVNGVMQDMAQNEIMIHMMFRVGGTPNSGFAFELRETGGAVLPAIGFDGDNDVTLRTSLTEDKLATGMGNGDFVNFVIRITDGEVAAAASWIDTSADTVFNPTVGDIVKHNVSITDTIETIMFGGTGVLFVTFLGMYDTTDIARTDEELIAIVNMDTTFGTPPDIDAYQTP